MPTCIALLRGINVGGYKKVAMSDLRALIADLGFGHPQTLLQSGNLVFEARDSGEKLERLIERELVARLAVASLVFVRTATEWQQVVQRNPFTHEAEHGPARLAVVALRAAPGAVRAEELQAAIRGPEVVRLDGRHLYAYYPDGMGRSRLTGALIEKFLGTAGTARNWNTVMKLMEKAGAANARAGV